MGQHETGYLSQTPRLYYQAWHPSLPAQGLVLIAHGMGGHGGQFASAALTLSTANFAVYAIDFRGHGFSDGARGYIRSWNNYLQDLELLVSQGQAAYPGLPTFLWGHSLGGLIALDDTIRHPHAFAGLILSAPAVGKTGVSPLMFALGRGLSWIWPRFSLEVKFDPRACSRDPVIVQRYNADPLHHRRGTARLSTEFQSAQARLRSQVDQLATPVLILHGGGDRITSPQDSVSLYKAITIADRKLIQYPHAYHELHLDINCDQVLGDMVTWMQAHGSGAYP